MNKLKQVWYGLDLDTFVDDGSTCIGWDGKMFRVGGLIPWLSAKINSNLINYIYIQRERERERGRDIMIKGGSKWKRSETRQRKVC